MSYVSEHHKLVAETLKKNFSRRNCRRGKGADPVHDP